MLAYLTNVSANHDAGANENAILASQEACCTWGLLSLCVRPDHNGGEEANKLARRFQILESLLTREPLTSTVTSMSRFIHQEASEPKPEPETRDGEVKKDSTFDKRVSQGIGRLLEST